MSDEGKPGGGAARRGGGGVRIDKIDAAPTSAAPERGWVTLLKAFNPLGPMAEAYAKTLAYRIESKRLALEAERVREQARTINNAIDKTFELKMEELQHRRIALERTFDLAEQHLSQIHIERMTVLKMVEVAHRAALTPGASMEERHMAKEMAIEMTKQLPSFGERGNQSLDTLVRALPIINMPRALLEHNE